MCGGKQRNQGAVVALVLDSMVFPHSVTVGVEDDEDWDTKLHRNRQRLDKFVLPIYRD